MDRSCPITQSFYIEKRLKKQKKEQELPQEVIEMCADSALAMSNWMDE